MKRVLIVLSAILLCVLAAQARLETVEEAPATAPADPVAEVAAEPGATPVQGLFDDSGLFGAAQGVPACLDLGEPCKGDRFCRKHVCGAQGSACQCNEPSGLDCVSNDCTCQVCS